MYEELQYSFSEIVAHSLRLPAGMQLIGWILLPTFSCYRFKNEIFDTITVEFCQKRWKYLKRENIKDPRWCSKVMKRKQQEHGVVVPDNKNGWIKAKWRKRYNRYKKLIRKEWKDRNCGKKMGKGVVGTKRKQRAEFNLRWWTFLRINCMFLSYQPFPLTTGNADLIFIPLISLASESIGRHIRFKWLRSHQWTVLFRKIMSNFSTS